MKANFVAQVILIAFNNTGKVYQQAYKKRKPESYSNVRFYNSLIHCFSYKFGYELLIKIYHVSNTNQN